MHAYFWSEGTKGSAGAGAFAAVQGSERAAVITTPAVNAPPVHPRGILPAALKLLSPHLDNAGPAPALNLDMHNLAAAIVLLHSYCHNLKTLYKLGIIANRSFSSHDETRIE